MVPSKWVSKPGQAEPEQLKTPSKVQRCGWFKETNAPSYKGEGPDSTREHLLPGGVGWDVGGGCNFPSAKLVFIITSLNLRL